MATPRMARKFSPETPDRAAAMKEFSVFALIGSGKVLFSDSVHNRAASCRRGLHTGCVCPRRVAAQISLAGPRIFMSRRVY